MTNPLYDEALSRQALLRSPGERQDVEYKASVPFAAGTDFTLKLIKHILGMANIGGGWIVIGYDDATLRPDTNHSAEIATTYDTTALSHAVNSVVERGQQIHLSVYKEPHPATTVHYPIIHVEGFERFPFICRSSKSATDTGALVLQERKVYIRRPGAETSEVSTQRDWQELIKQCVLQQRGDYLNEFADLLRRLSSGEISPTENVSAAFKAWMAEVKSDSSTQGHLSPKGGYIESAQALLHSPASKWTTQQLLGAARRIKLPSVAAATPLTDGIEARMPAGYSSGYFYVKNDGMFYHSMPFFEDTNAPSFTSSLGTPDKWLGFDIRIVMIAGALLRGVALYRELGVPPNEPYLLSVNHGRLQGRDFYASRWYFPIDPGRTSHADLSEWQREVTQDIVTTQLKELTHAIGNSLFSLFNFASVPQGMVSRLIDDHVTNRS